MTVQPSPFFTQSLPLLTAVAAFVASGRDPVADPGRGAVVQRYAVDRDAAVANQVGPGPRVQLVDGRGGRGEEEGVAAGADVGEPRRVGGVRHRRVGAGEDPAVGQVVVGGRGVAASDLQGGFGFGGVGEPEDFVHPDRADLVLEVPQHSAGLDRGELLVVTDATAPRHRPHVARSTSRSSIRVPAIPASSTRINVPGCDGGLVVVELGERVGGDAEFLAEHVRGGGRRCERDDRLAGGPPGVGDGPHGGGLAGAGGREAELDAAAGAAERPHQRRLPVVQRPAAVGWLGRGRR